MDPIVWGPLEEWHMTSGDSIAKPDNGLEAGDYSSLQGISLVVIYWALLLKGSHHLGIEKWLICYHWLFFWRKITQNHLPLVPGDPVPSSGPWTPATIVVHRQQAKHSYK